MSTRLACTLSTRLACTLDTRLACTLDTNLSVRDNPLLVRDDHCEREC
jgi:hypothetical protein